MKNFFYATFHLGQSDDTKATSNLQLPCVSILKDYPPAREAPLVLHPSGCQTWRGTRWHRETPWPTKIVHGKGERVRDEKMKRAKQQVACRILPFKDPQRQTLKQWKKHTHTQWCYGYYPVPHLLQVAHVTCICAKAAIFILDLECNDWATHTALKRGEVKYYNCRKQLTSQQVIQWSHLVSKQSKTQKQSLKERKATEPDLIMRRQHLARTKVTGGNISANSATKNWRRHGERYDQRVPRSKMIIWKTFHFLLLLQIQLRSMNKKHNKAGVMNGQGEGERRTEESGEQDRWKWIKDRHYQPAKRLVAGKGHRSSAPLLPQTVGTASELSCVHPAAAICGHFFFSDVLQRTLIAKIGFFLPRTLWRKKR